MYRPSNGHVCLRCGQALLRKATPQLGDSSFQPTQREEQFARAAQGAQTRARLRARGSARPGARSLGALPLIDSEVRPCSGRLCTSSYAICSHWCRCSRGRVGRRSGDPRGFAADERPQALALAAATGGASIIGLALPSRCADLVRIAIVHRYPGCPAGVRTLCLSLVMLGLIEIAALAPLALALAVVPGHSRAVRAGLALVAGVGFAAATLVVVLPRVATSGRLARSRLGRWLRPRATSRRAASGAWALVSVS